MSSWGFLHWNVFAIWSTQCEEILLKLLTICLFFATLNSKTLCANLTTWLPNSPDNSSKNVLRERERDGKHNFPSHAEALVHFSSGLPLPHSSGVRDVSWLSSPPWSTRLQPTVKESFFPFPPFCKLF